MVAVTFRNYAAERAMPYRVYVTVSVFTYVVETEPPRLFIIEYDSGHLRFELLRIPTVPSEAELRKILEGMGLSDLTLFSESRKEIPSEDMEKILKVWKIIAKLMREVRG